MMDQLIIGDKYSFDDFDASLATRKIGLPKKKKIKDTVPYSNNTYDFSKINGELYWEERELEYVFEIIANTPEELEDAKTKFSEWIMNVMEEEIHDPFIPDYHFVGTFDDISFDDDEALDKTTITVKFTAYPYKIANNLTVYTFTVPASQSLTFSILKESNHPILPVWKVSANCALDLTINGYTQLTAISAGELSDSRLLLTEKLSNYKVYAIDGIEVNVEVSFREELL